MERPQDRGRAFRESRGSLESRFVRFMVALIVVVASIQVLLRFEGPRRFLNESIRMEGESLSRAVQGLSQPAYPWLEWPPPDDAQAASTWATMYLRLMGPPPKEVWVIVNGRVTKQLGSEGGTVTVKSGDAIEIYCPNGEISVVVSAATDNLVSPPLGKWVTGTGTVCLGVVKLK